ncbi:MAG: Hpt domain-containing protein [Chitinophagaceae bacterium]|nr:MAG: Hpt domain-containing protein [Chitinophagaceae bacterium]
MNYRFSDQLDLAKLQEFYDGDPRLASGVFEAFVQETVTALPDLDQLYLSGDLAEFKRLVHKIKPGFLYVGLTALYGKLSDLEILCEKANDVTDVAGPFKDVQGRLGEEITWVENELKKLKEFEALPS